VNIVAEENDTLFHPYSVDVCPNQQKYIDEQTGTKLYKDIERNMSSVLDKAAKQVNMPRKGLSMKKVKTLVSNLNCDLYDGREIPIDLNSELGRNLTFMQNFYILYGLFGTENQIKSSATPFFSNLIQLYNDSIQNNSQTKLVFFSGHDYNLVYLLNALGLVGWECLLANFQSGIRDRDTCKEAPGFASSLNFELYEQGGEHFVKVLYNGEEKAVCQNKSNNLCPYNEFVSLLKTKMTDKFEELCGNSIINVAIKERDLNIEKDSDDFQHPVMLFILICALTMLGVNAWLLWKARQTTHYFPQEREGVHLEMV